MLGKLFRLPAVVAALSALIALVVGEHYFPNARIMASAALIAISLTTLTQRKLDENRIAIWEEKHSPYQANLALAGYFLTVFTAIFLVALIFDAVWLDRWQAAPRIAPRYRNQFLPLFAHNSGVLLACGLLPLVYGSGALTLVLTWNALNWSQSLSPVLLYSDHSLFARTLYAASLLPHLVCEVLAYVLAGMAGTFFGKALLKYNLLSMEFHRVSRACVVIILFSLSALLLGSLFEVHLAGSASMAPNRPQ
jgi:hypothetical protein